MESSSHPSVGQLLEAVRGRGGTAACTVCGGEEFSAEQIAPLAASGAYGSRRLSRTQLTCENCGHVMNFDLEKIRSDLPK